MKTSQTGRSIIEAFEGCDKPVKGKPGFFTTYRDEVNVLTVCYGCTNLSGNHAPIVEGAVYSKADCDALLSSDLDGFETRVARIIGQPLAQHEFDALVSFDFNTGGLDRSSIPAKIKDGRKVQVPETLARWNKAGGVVYRGLTRRRTAEGQEFIGQVASALSTAGVHRVSGDGMVQQVDRPTPPASEVAKVTKRERRAAAGGATAGGTGTLTQSTAPGPEAGQGLDGLSLVAWGLIVLGVVVVAAAAVLAWRKWRHLDANWA